MNVFVLTTGRTGSLSFTKACMHASNYTTSHESKSELIGDERLDYPDNHIEIDNRLAWFLGGLEKKYGDEAIYVHLIRDRKQVANSYLKRWSRETNIASAYAYGILKRQEHQIKDRFSICLDLVDTINTNIEAFLINKTKKMTFHLENGEEDFTRFWELIGAEGDLKEALKDFNAKYNATGSDKNLNAFWNKTARIIKKLPYFIKNA